MKNSGGSTSSETSVGEVAVLGAVDVDRDGKGHAVGADAEDHHFLDASGVVDCPPDAVANRLIRVKTQREQAHVPDEPRAQIMDHVEGGSGDSVEARGVHQYADNRNQQIGAGEARGNAKLLTVRFTDDVSQRAKVEAAAYEHAIDQ